MLVGMGKKKKSTNRVGLLLPYYYSAPFAFLAFVILDGDGL